MSDNTESGAVGGTSYATKKAFSTTERYDLERELNQLSIAQQQMKAADGIKDHGHMIDSAVHDYMANKIHIGITGSSGTGKSSLINCLRSLTARDEGAATSGTTETTMQLTPYPFRDNPNVVLWDMPGVGTPKFKKENYVEDVKLERFQALLICTVTRFTESDLWLVGKAKMNNVKCYLVRTKIDNDVRSILEDEGLDDVDCNQDVVAEKLSQVRRSIRNELEKIQGPNISIYLLSTRIQHQGKWDFAQLNKALADDAPEKNKNTVLMLLISCSTDIIEDKRKALKEGIEKVARKASEVSEQEYQDVIMQEVKHYITWFGVGDEQLQRANIKLERLDQNIQDMHYDLHRIINKSVKEYTGYRDYYGWIPFVGHTIGKWWDDGENLRRKTEREQECKEMVEEIATRTPQKIKNLTISLLQSLLEICVEIAMGVLAERKA